MWLKASAFTNKPFSASLHKIILSTQVNRKIHCIFISAKETGGSVGASSGAQREGGSFPLL